MTADPAKAFGSIDLNLIYPPFLGRLIPMFESLWKQGYVFHCDGKTKLADGTVVETGGTRSFVLQHYLYGQGRTRPGPVITNADAGQSAHCFGIATDVIAFVNGQPTWDDAAYAILGPEAAKVGLVWGGSWGNFPDRPHIQWPNYVSAEQMLPLKALVEADPHQSPKACWMYLAEHP